MKSPMRIYNREAAALASNESSGVIGSLRIVGRALRNTSFTDLILGLITIAIIYGFRYVTEVVPSTLVALLGVSAGAFLILPEYRTMGQIPSGFPAIEWEVFSKFSFAQIRPYLGMSASLAALGAIDSLLTSIVADNMTKTKHRPNQELIGQGIGNSVAAIFGGIPGAGATIRTVVNVKSGGHTKLSGNDCRIAVTRNPIVFGTTRGQNSRRSLSRNPGHSRESVCDGLPGATSHSSLTDH